MRGADVMQEQLFTAGGLDQFVPSDHPLRRVREVFNGCLSRMDTHFDTLYSVAGRESIPPEKLLRALMLQVLFGIRSERQIIEQLRYNMLYRWFVGLPCTKRHWTTPPSPRTATAWSQAAPRRYSSTKYSTVPGARTCYRTNISQSMAR